MILVTQYNGEGCFQDIISKALRDPKCVRLFKGRLVCLKVIYRTRAIISCGLYIFYPIFKDNFFVFKEVFSENYFLMYGLYSRAACNQERLMMARVRYLT